MPQLTAHSESSVRRTFNDRASQIAGVFRYLSNSGKRSMPTNWNRLLSNIGFLRSAEELLRDGKIDAAARTLKEITWPAGWNAPYQEPEP